jgi:hypothetical protein
MLGNEVPQLHLHAHLHEQVHEPVARVVPELGEPCDMVRPTISSYKQLSLEKWWDDLPGSSPFSTFDML